MLLLTRKETDYLRNKGLGKYIQTINKTHKSRRKTYYGTASEKLIKALEEYHSN